MFREVKTIQECFQMPTILELREKRGGAVKQARAVLEKAQTEKREMSGDESAQFDKWMKESDDLKVQIDSIEAGEKRSKALADAEKELETRTEPKTRGDQPTNQTIDREQVDAEYARWSLRSGERREIHLVGKRSAPEYRAAFKKFIVAGSTAGLEVGKGVGGELEERDLQADLDTQGGYILPPMQQVAALIKAVDDAVQIRQFATVMQLRGAQSLGAPSLDSDPADPDWTSEIATGTNDTAMSFGRRELSPSPLAKRIKVSRKLLRLAPAVEQLVMSRLAYKFGVAEERNFLLGSGANQPLGMFTASANGIPTSRDVTTGTTSAVTADGLIETKFALKAAYWARARWLFHRTTLKQIRLLKDAQNQYLWQPGLTANTPDTILDSPYIVSEFAPSTYTTGQYVTLYGDMSFYWIAESLAMEVQRLDQLYAEANQVGFIGRMELDGMPVLAEAFVRGKLA